ncbi:MAG: M23 family metallopeptidase [Candidatus Faecousia sp.]|nr:M23 family metallopeptidase [Clostridiales bacterium]MDD6297578.1 M23 family metallopeptidase [Bacillota bacterium]MDD7341079.1 M23 family metallopeptidase [Bacillota bacterium]MDY2809582.1 M23 family metallopeptidase [Candidatus Faecousia sp.]
MSRKMNGSAAGKGYYIALILCAVAIGISGYLYYKNANSEPDRQANEPAAVTGGKDVPAVATKPTTTQPPATAAAEKPLKTASPLEGETAAAFAMDALAYNPTTRDWRTHDGVDIAAEAGTEVKAAAAGTVYSVYTDDQMGTTVVIRHTGGYSTTYASLAEDPAVAAGDEVELGQTIGAVGQSALLESAIGDHLHFAVSKDGENVDPMEFLGK